MGLCGRWCIISTCETELSLIVPRLKTCKESALSETTLSALSTVRQKGRLADVYLQFANSEPALSAYLLMEQALQSGSLAEREIEAIKLLVSELTQCRYCLAVHTFKSTQAGLDERQQLAIRRGEPIGDDRVDAVVAIAGALFSRPGELDQQRLNDGRNAGLTDENLVDLCMAMATIFFTNITNHINQSETALPPAPALNNA